MSLGERLLNLRKNKQLSQEEAAERLGVTRQTISKWETDQSQPDFDKIVPLCELYSVSTEELLTGNKVNNLNDKNDLLQNEQKNLRSKRAKGIGLGVLMYFVSIVFIMITIPVLRLNPIVASALFLLICGIATFIIIYTCIKYKQYKTDKEEKEDKVRKQIESVIGVVILILYLIVSFATMAWHITWLLWIVMGLISEILKLIFMLRGNKNEK